MSDTTSHVVATVVRVTHEQVIAVSSTFATIYYNSTTGNVTYTNTNTNTLSEGLYNLVLNVSFTGNILVMNCPLAIVRTGLSSVTYYVDSETVDSTFRNTPGHVANANVCNPGGTSSPDYFFGAARSSNASVNTALPGQTPNIQSYSISTNTFYPTEIASFSIDQQELKIPGCSYPGHMTIGNCSGDTAPSYMYQYYTTQWFGYVTSSVPQTIQLTSVDVDNNVIMYIRSQPEVYQPFTAWPPTDIFLSASLDYTCTRAAFPKPLFPMAANVLYPIKIQYLQAGGVARLDLSFNASGLTFYTYGYTGWTP